MLKTHTTEQEVFEAMGMAAHLEQLQLASRIARLTAIVREHGLALPEEDPRLGASDGEHLEASRRVVIAAYDLLVQMDEFTAALADLRTMVGSGMELVGGESWRAPQSTEQT